MCIPYNITAYRAGDYLIDAFDYNHDLSGRLNFINLDTHRYKELRAAGGCIYKHFYTQRPYGPLLEHGMDLRHIYK